MLAESLYTAFNAIAVVDASGEIAEDTKISYVYGILGDICLLLTMISPLSNILFYWNSPSAHYFATYWDGQKFIGYNVFSGETGPKNLGTSLVGKFNKKPRRIGVLISISKK